MLKEVIRSIISSPLGVGLVAFWLALTSGSPPFVSACLGLAAAGAGQLALAILQAMPPPAWRFRCRRGRLGIIRVWRRSGAEMRVWIGGWGRRPEWIRGLLVRVGYVGRRRLLLRGGKSPVIMLLGASARQPTVVVVSPRMVAMIRAGEANPRLARLACRAQGVSWPLDGPIASAILAS